MISWWNANGNKRKQIPSFSEAKNKKPVMVNPTTRPNIEIKYAKKNQTAFRQLVGFSEQLVIINKKL